MPLQQPIPSRYSTQVVIAKQSSTNIAEGDHLFSITGAKFGTTGKEYIGLPFPWIRIQFLNEGTGTAALKVFRASDGCPLWGTIIAAATDADGRQFKACLVPNTDINGITLSTTKVNTPSLSIVAIGITDSGLLPVSAESTVRRGGMGETFQIAGSAGGGGSQTASGSFGMGGL